jgi:hypothetical protein
LLRFPCIHEGPPDNDFRTSYLWCLWLIEDFPALKTIEQFVRNAIIEYYRSKPIEKLYWKRTAAIQAILAERIKEAAPLHSPPDLFDFVDAYPGQSLEKINWQEIGYLALEQARLDWNWRW